MGRPRMQFCPVASSRLGYFPHHTVLTAAHRPYMHACHELIDSLKRGGRSLPSQPVPNDAIKTAHAFMNETAGMCLKKGWWSWPLTWRGRMRRARRSPSRNGGKTAYAQAAERALVAVRTADAARAARQRKRAREQQRVLARPTCQPIAPPSPFQTVAFLQIHHKIGRDESRLRGKPSGFLQIASTQNVQLHWSSMKLLPQTPPFFSVYAMLFTSQALLTRNMQNGYTEPSVTHA